MCIDGQTELRRPDSFDRPLDNLLEVELIRLVRPGVIGTALLVVSCYHLECDRRETGWTELANSGALL